MIKIRHHDHYDPRAWAELVASCDGNPLHLPAVTESDHPDTPPRFLVLEQEGHPVGCALAYAPSHRRWRVGARIRDLELPTAPALRIGPDPGGAKREALAALVAFAGSQRCRSLVIHPRWGLNLADLEFLSRYLVSPTLEFELNLEVGLDTLRASFHRFHRKNIRRAERNSLEIVSDPTVAGLRRLRDFQILSAQRSAARGGGFHIRDEAYFARIHALVYARGLGDVLFAREGDTFLAGLAYIATGTKGITVRSGSTPEGYEKLAMYLLQDAVIQRAVERGLRRLNLGGVPEAASQEGHVQHGLLEFKRGFGGAAFLRHGVRMPIATARG